ncbi:MAG: M23 family metallopeptidase, partial [Bacteroidales bacterium]|nr:M23 family metallopeptidase [Bacteroidales bacterium]
MGRFIYDPENLQYHQIDKSFRGKLLRILFWVGSNIILGLLIVILYSFFFDTPRERELRQENFSLMEDYHYLNQKYSRIDTVLNELQSIDENIYRTIFETEPTHNKDREISGFENYFNLVNHDGKLLVSDTKKGLDELYREVNLSEAEYYYLKQNIADKSEYIQSIPAIQPLKNPDLSRLASGFGNRMHPIYKIVKFHEGMDFTAPTGTEVFATGNGVIAEVERTRRGRGNTVIIDHGYGYQSIYSHLEGFNVKKGQGVKRGQQVGIVGNTGLSVAPHLHYEVRLNGKPVNPVNYFFLELDPEQYNKMIELSIKSGQSF